MKVLTFKTDDGKEHIAGFHHRDGWFFYRQSDGSVRVFHIQELSTDFEPDVDHIIDPDSWASIVASMSKNGETAESYRLTRDLHMGIDSKLFHDLISGLCVCGHRDYEHQGGGVQITLGQYPRCSIRRCDCRRFTVVHITGEKP